MAADASEQRRRSTDRRRGEDRRAIALDLSAVPTWPEQRSQFGTRLLFWVLGFIYFQLDGGNAAWPSMEVVYIGFALYGLIVIPLFAHAWRVLNAPWRWRMAMWTDIAFVTFCIVTDRNAISPGWVAYIIVALGNGMRYRLPFFREAVVGCFIGGAVALAFRYIDYLSAVSLATVFVVLFGGIIILYSYSLMERIERAREKLEAEGRVDALTGLLNRRALQEKAAVLFNVLDRGQKTLAVIFADLDKFKIVNDRMGHRAGDRVLSQVAALLANCARRSDIVARYGGDEFIVIMPDARQEHAFLLAERMLEAVRQWSARNDVDVSVSIGIGEAPRHGAQLPAVLEQVDRALYKAKHSDSRGAIQLCEPVRSDMAAPPARA